MKTFKKLVSHAMFLLLAGACSSSQHTDSINLVEISPAQMAYHSGDTITAMTDENCADCKIVVADNQLPKTFYTDIVPVALTNDEKKSEEDIELITVPTGQVPIVDCTQIQKDKIAKNLMVNPGTNAGFSGVAANGCYVDVWVRSADDVESNHIQIFVSNNEETGNPAIDECPEGTEWDGVECVEPEIAPTVCANDEFMFFGTCNKALTCKKDSECGEDTMSCQSGYCKPGKSKSAAKLPKGSQCITGLSVNPCEDNLICNKNICVEKGAKETGLKINEECIKGYDACAENLYCKAKEDGEVGKCTKQFKTGANCSDGTCKDQTQPGVKPNPSPAEPKTKSNLSFGMACTVGKGECAATLYCEGEKGEVGGCLEKWQDNSGFCDFDYQCLSNNCDKSKDASGGICVGQEPIKKEASYSFTGESISTNPIGGVTGDNTAENYSYKCNAGEYVFAVAVHAGAEIDKIHIECRNLSEVLAVTSPNLTGNLNGQGYNKVHISEINSGYPEFFRGFKIYAAPYGGGKHVVIQGIQPSVYFMDKVSTFGVKSAIGGGTYWGEAEGVKPSVFCPNNYILTGVHGFVGDRLDNVGLYCSEIELK